MLPDGNSSSRLCRAYLKFLATEHSAEFVESVAGNYTLPTLEKLLWLGPETIRRAAALAIGFLGDFDSNEWLGRALSDRDRGVRLLADHGIRQLWFRAGSTAARQMLVRSAWLNRCGKHDEAIELCRHLMKFEPQVAEIRNQLASGLAALGDHAGANEERRELLYLNRFHFVAASAMATSYLQMDDMTLALDSFRMALEINPDLENVRAQIDQLERIVGG